MARAVEATAKAKLIFYCNLIESSHFSIGAHEKAIKSILRMKRRVAQE